MIAQLNSTYSSGSSTEVTLKLKLYELLHFCLMVDVSGRMWLPSNGVVQCSDSSVGSVAARIACWSVVRFHILAFSFYSVPVWMSHRWRNDFYRQRFRRYPRRYLVGVTQGSRTCSLLSWVLPVQAQIVYVYPGYCPALFNPSDHVRDMQNRLSLNPTFANWFYFDFCSKNQTVGGH